MRRGLLLFVLLLVGVNALGGAWYGLLGAPGVPDSWLDGSPFSSYLVPSLVLGIVVGGSQLLAAMLVARRHRQARQAVLLAAVLLAGWIVAQVAIIGPVSWLQPAMFAAAVLEAALASSARGSVVHRSARRNTYG